MAGLENISNLLGLAPQHLFSLVAASEECYVDAEIPKASGLGMRSIKIPSKALKGVQKLILREILSQVKVDDAAHAYIQGRSVITACKKMSGPKAIVKIDIADFFPSITFKRVFGIFRSLDFENDESFILSRLTTLEDKLPQGAPTSPAISNIIFRSLDGKLRVLAKTWDMEYIRYSDDLFFVNDRNFNHPKFVEKCSLIIEQGGFVVNQGKTKFYAKGVPRKTLGLLTHGGNLAIPGPMRRKIRSAFHRGSRNIGWGQENASTLRGMLEWYKLVYGKNDTYFHYYSVLQTILRLKLHVSYQSV